MPIFSTQDGNSISIDVKHWSFVRFFHIGYVNVDIHVPGSLDIQMQCNAGTISIVESALQGNTVFTTNAGTIQFDGELSPNSDSLFKTNAGTIDAILPSGSSFALTAHTSLGSVRNDFHDNLVGHGPYGRLNLESQMGTISVRRK